ncbi:hypothetical protein [Desulfospira joergensenii]|uniref:hypothetical protein n=1 Tax=Desulfospira joergensenii TaxID=53329 RepID=UPI0003B637AE|nr:hypothetical protein [Desulfospira joergensenii]
MMNTQILQRIGLNLLITVAVVFMWACPGAAGEIDRSFNFKVNFCILPLLEALDPGKMSISYNGLSRGRNLPMARSQSDGSLQKTDLGILLQDQMAGGGLTGLDQRLGRMADFVLRYIRPAAAQAGEEEIQWQKSKPAAASRPMRKDMLLEFEAKGSDVSGAILFTMPI